MTREQIQQRIEYYRNEEQKAVIKSNQCVGAVIALQELLATMPEVDEQNPPNIEG